MVPSSEFSEWLAFEKVEVQDPERSDWRAALATTQVVNHLIAVMGGKGRVKVEDMVLKMQPAAPSVPDPKTVEIKLKSWLNMLRSKKAVPFEVK